jgi:hypothetical protein
MNEQQQPAGSSGADPDRRRLQEILDREFPEGALCAVMTRVGGRIEEDESCATGRLVCEGAERNPDGVWYRITIDPRRSVDEESEVIQLWTGEPHRCHDSKHLWEADVRTPEDTTSILRLNASPPEPWRPSIEMRSAVTERYAGYLKTPVGSA